MSEEEKKAIEDLKEMINKSRDLREEDFYKLIGIHNIQAIATVLNLIEKQDEMINLMAGRIVELLEEKNITNHSKKDVIDTFKNLAVNNLLKEE